MVLGIALGLLAPAVALPCKILGDIFLRLIRTAIAPLVFLCVAAGIVSAGDFRRVGKLGVVALVYFELVSTVALVLGLVAGHVLGVGRNTPLPAVAAGSAVTRGASRTRRTSSSTSLPTTSSAPSPAASCCRCWSSH
jgi:aerobic C4-dicarboxylate transport protein